MIRRAARGDLPRLAALARRAVESAWDEAAFGAELERSIAQLRVLEREGQVIGLSLVWIVPPEASLLILAVDAAHERRGHGASLLHAACAEASAAGCAVMLLEVSEANAAARALYRRAGFDEVGRRAGYYAGSGATALVLSRALT